MKRTRKITYLITGLILSAFSLLGFVGSTYANWRESQCSGSGENMECWAIGYFDEHPCQDLIITDKSGSYWYTGKDDEEGICNFEFDFTKPKLVNPGLNIGTASFTTGDFNGDMMTDLIITTKSGSYWYFAKGEFTFEMVHHRPDLPFVDGPYGGVEFTTGHFNDDNMKDLIITAPSGSTGYYSNGDGTWTKFWGTQRIFTSHTTDMKSEDFDFDGLDDLVMIVGHTIYVWYSNVGGRWEKHPIDNIYQVAGAGDKHLEIYGNKAQGVARFTVYNKFTGNTYYYNANGARGSFSLHIDD